MTIDTARWMDLVQGSRLLTELSIPGTHNSGAINPVSDAGRLTTQARSIGEQLADGIRFFDIRAGYTNNEFALYHENVSVGLGFTDVLNAYQTFLAANPREAVIMSLKQEDDAPTSGNTEGKSFQARFDDYVTAYPGLFYLENRFPRLSEVRGKVVLFRRFRLDDNTSPATHGIAAFDGFASGRVKGPPEILIQDSFFVPFDSDKQPKLDLVERFLEKAQASSETDKLFVNFASGAGTLGPTEGVFPSGVSGFINPKLVTYFRTAPRGRYGIVLTDFERVELNKLIIATNLALQGGYWIATGSGAASAFGSAPAFPTQQQPANVIAIAPRLNGTGYYLLGVDGKVYPFGTATHEGQGIPAGTQAVSMAVKPTSADPTGRLGYWILSTNGKVQTYNARRYGQIESGTNLEAVSIVATPDGGGYWILAANGRVHNFGNAGHFGDRRDAGQISVAMARTPTGNGYWLLSSRGAVHAFGGAVHYGQDKEDGTTARAIAATRDGTGYWILSTAGAVTPYGSADYLGRVRDTEAAVGIAADLRSPPAAPAGTAD